MPDPSPSSLRRRSSFASLSKNRAMAFALADDEAANESIGRESPKRGDIMFASHNYAFINDADNIAYDGAIYNCTTGTNRSGVRTLRKGALIGHLLPLVSLYDELDTLSVELQKERLDRPNDKKGGFLRISLSSKGWGYELFEPKGKGQKEEKSIKNKGVHIDHPKTLLRHCRMFFILMHTFILNWW